MEKNSHLETKSVYPILSRSSSPKYIFKGPEMYETIYVYFHSQWNIPGYFCVTDEGHNDLFPLWSSLDISLPPRITKGRFGKCYII